MEGRLLAMFLETQDDGGLALLSTVTTNGGIKVTYEVMVDPNDPNVRPNPVQPTLPPPPVVVTDPYYPTDEIVDGSEEDEARWDAIHNHIQSIHDKVETIHNHVVG